MAAAYQRDQWKPINSGDTDAESGTEEATTPADPTRPWDIKANESIFIPMGTS